MMNHVHISASGIRNRRQFKAYVATTYECLVFRPLVLIFEVIARLKVFVPGYR